MRVIILLFFCFIHPLLWAQHISAGLRGEYYQGVKLEKKVATRVDLQINFHWDPLHKPVANLEVTNFSVRWTGRLYAPQTGIYYFSSVADDGLKLWLGGIKILDDWQQPSQERVMDARYVRSKRGSCYLLAQQWIDIRLEYYNRANKSEIVLYWELPDDTKSELGFQGIFRRVIPTQNLSPNSQTAQTSSPVTTPTKPLIAQATLTKQSPKPSLLVNTALVGQKPALYIVNREWTDAGEKRRDDFKHVVTSEKYDFSAVSAAITA